MGSDGCVFRTPCFYVVTRNSQVSQQRRDPGTPCFYVVTQIPRSRNSGETWGTPCFYVVTKFPGLATAARPGAPCVLFRKINSRIQPASRRTRAAATGGVPRLGRASLGGVFLRGYWRDKV